MYIVRNILLYCHIEHFRSDRESIFDFCKYFMSHFYVVMTPTRYNNIRCSDNTYIIGYLQATKLLTCRVGLAHSAARRLLETLGYFSILGATGQPVEKWENLYLNHS